ncbi:hypothetical protein [Akkermansia sp.]|uniref:hypothetical protein n=1 Tax=Akkermansia sp. TaxID=1872421 RepID=UPI0025BF1DE9|nr:hypothetical protein [Akkermansia sp.]MCC8148516.1 hypothetical protein [Akkermansia sp.]
MKIKHLLLASFALLAVSCTNRLADLTVASTKNMDLKHTAGYTTNYNVRSKGEDKKHIVLFFPTGFPNVKEAIDNAIEKNGPNCVGLTNATLEEKWFYIPFIYGQISFVAEGDPIMRKD